MYFYVYMFKHVCQHTFLRKFPLKPPPPTPSLFTPPPFGKVLAMHPKLYYIFLVGFYNNQHKKIYNLNTDSLSLSLSLSLSIYKINFLIQYTYMFMKINQILKLSYEAIQFQSIVIYSRHKLELSLKYIR